MTAFQYRNGHPMSIATPWRYHPSSKLSNQSGLPYIIRKREDLMAQLRRSIMWRDKIATSCSKKILTINSFLFFSASFLLCVFFSPPSSVLATSGNIQGWLGRVMQGSIFKGVVRDRIIIFFCPMPYRVLVYNIIKGRCASEGRKIS